MNRQMIEDLSVALERAEKEAARLNKQTKSLADAMWQVLDDMGKDGSCVCLATKAQARIAYEPFSDPRCERDFMPLAEARRILAEADGE